MEINKQTWEELKKVHPGTILHDVMDEGLRFLVTRGPSTLCAYVGVPLDHPLADHNYDDIPVQAHGGLTFAQKGDGKPWAEGYFWYGWDYGHCDDYAFYYDDPPLNKFSNDGKKWLVEDVVKDSWDTLYDFHRLVRLSEAIRLRYLNLEPLAKKKE